MTILNAKTIALTCANMDRYFAINADDFGRSERISSAILECFKKGWITQTTLMVNMPYADEAVARAKSVGYGDKVGLHLNLTEGEPLTDSIKKYRSICDASGSFTAHKVGIYGLRPFGSEDFRQAIREEVRAQIEKYCSYGLPLMHCDGHHHVHNRLRIALEVLPLLKEYGFKTVRNQYTPFLRYKFLTRKPLSYLYGRWQHRIFMREVHANNLTTTEGFGRWVGDSLDKWRAFPSFEIMVHPNYNASSEIVNVLDYASVSGPYMSDLKRKVDSFVERWSGSTLSAQ